MRTLYALILLLIIVTMKGGYWLIMRRDFQTAPTTHFLKEKNMFIERN